MSIDLSLATRSVSCCCCCCSRRSISLLSINLSLLSIDLSLAVSDATIDLSAVDEINKLPFQLIRRRSTYPLLAVGRSISCCCCCR
jgi:hypothetical protein